MGDIKPKPAQYFINLMEKILEEKRKNQTNEKWFASLTTEEKAMAIVLCCPYEINWFGENFEKRMEQRMKNLSQSAQGYELGIQKIKEWLEQPHKE